MDIKKFFIIIVVLLVSWKSLAALSATTANTIQGIRPVLAPGTGQGSLSAHSSFKVNGAVYRESDGSYTNSTLFSGSLKLSDFFVTGLSPSDFDGGYFYSPNGDAADPAVPLVIPSTGLSYRWIDNSNTLIPVTQYSTDLATLSSTYIFPLMLEIKNDNVYVQSQYGDPNTSLGATITKSYLISYETGFYAVKPAGVGKSCQWIEKTNGSGSDSDGWVCASQGTDAQNGHVDVYGGGYSSDYLPDIGFKAKPSGNVFPTVGFSGAEFQLVMVGNQSDYTFSIASGSGISVGATDGVVKIYSRPTGEVEIKAHHNPSNFDYIYNFTINKWVTPKAGKHNYASAVTECGGVDNIITRSDFTNSPIASIPQNSDWPYVRNYGTRAIDGTIYGEWGYLDNVIYPSSNWQNNRYWTKDVNQNNSPNVNKNFFVHSFDGGYIGDEWADNATLAVVCK